MQFHEWITDNKLVELEHKKGVSLNRDTDFLPSIRRTKLDYSGCQSVPDKNDPKIVARKVQKDYNLLEDVKGVLILKKLYEHEEAKMGRLHRDYFGVERMIQLEIAEDEWYAKKRSTRYVYF